MDFPEWVTPSNLGSFRQDYSFEVNPITLEYGAGLGSTVTQINGVLPAGLRLEKSANVVKLLGRVVESSQNIVVKFTLRISQTNGAIADRTFFLELTDVPLAPSWEDQKTFLGYQNNTLPQAYQLTAHAPVGQYITYGIQSVTVVPFAAVSVEIDPQTGLLSCDASNVATNNTIITVVVRASADQHSDITCAIEVITVASTPKWITPAGSLGIYAGGDFIEINLIAKDLNNGQVTYSMVSNPNSAPLTVAKDGLLYGRLNNITTETFYTFVVSATNENGTSTRSFTIIAVPSQLLSLLQWQTGPDLGTINDGEFCSIPIKATTKRNRTIIYNLTGGNLPPNLLITKTGGAIWGFCEYHAVPKVYTFNISAYDGYQTITKQFTLSVNKKYNDMFFSLAIPVMGDKRNAWIVDAANVRVREPSTIVFDTFDNIENPPTLNVIKGVVTGYDDPEKIYGEISPWLHQLDLQFGLASNTSITSNNTVIYRNIIDSQSGANLTVVSQSLGNTNVQTNGIVTPISIENIRKSLTKNRTFISSGGGSSLSFSPVLNWSSGSIDSIKIIEAGQNYTSPPEIKISGSGTDAQLRAVLGIVELKIINGGIDWAVGDVIDIDIGRALSLARITVTEVGPTGNISAFVIDEPGDYLQVPLISSATVRKNTISSATFDLIWGITSVKVVNGGKNYQNSISFNIDGFEILPWWQTTYNPIITVGNINGISGSTATFLLNNETTTLFGKPWKPNYIVFKWEGLRWLGLSTFDETLTTFDGDSTRFEETESAYDTIFDSKRTIFDDTYTTFDYIDPLAYDQGVVWGTTVFDNNATIFNYYSTAFDKATPKKHSNTLWQKLVRVNNKAYSGNNIVY